jgi:hypothetical protein
MNRNVHQQKSVWRKRSFISPRKREIFDNQFSYSWSNGGQSVIDTSLEGSSDGLQVTSSDLSVALDD